MLLLIVKVGHFFYELPNVSGTDQISKPRKPHLQIASWWASLRRIAFSSSPASALACRLSLSFPIIASTSQDWELNKILCII